LGKAVWEGMMFKRNAVGKEISDHQKALEYSKVLDAMAIAKEPEVVAEFPKRLAQYKADHRKVSRGFKFECRRHGDFMALFFSQGSEKDGLFSIVINLGQVTSMRLKLGHAPDLNGVVEWSVSTRSTDKFGWGTSSGRPMGPPSDGWEHHVSPDIHERYFFSDQFYRTVSRDEYSQNIISMGGGVDHVTKNAPRPAENDQIFLSGLDGIISVPYGHGQNVLDEILAQIKTVKPSIKMNVGAQ
jgi:hypothetical protein